jgi:hypothetical protein
VTTPSVPRPLRALAVAAFIVALSGTLPTTVICLDQPGGCRGHGTMCLCKRGPARTGVRAPCACSTPTSTAGDLLTGTGPAILPARSIATAPGSPPDLVSRRTGGPVEFSPSVPHPPPRTLPAA